MKAFLSGIWYGLSGRYALDGVRELYQWARQWLAIYRLRRDFARRAAQSRKAWATPWGMLDREEWYEVMRKHGVTPDEGSTLRFIYSDEL